MRRRAAFANAGSDCFQPNFFFVSSCLRGPNTPLITLMLLKAHAARSCRRFEPSEPARRRWRLAG